MNTNDERDHSKCVRAQTEPLGAKFTGAVHSHEGDTLYWSFPDGHADREHSQTGTCTLAPDRPRADVGLCRACTEQGLFDALVNAPAGGEDVTDYAAGLDPMTVGCEACGAEPGETCRPGCIGQAVASEAKPPAHLPAELVVKFSEIHLYEVRVPTAELYEAYGADVAGMTGPVDDYADEDAALAVNELLTRYSIDQYALIETDGMEISSVRRPDAPGGQLGYDQTGGA